MKIAKGETWVVATRGSNALEIQVLQDVFTHEDTFFEVKIISGERLMMSRGAAKAVKGDIISLRTSLTTWRKQIKT